MHEDQLVRPISTARLIGRRLRCVPGIFVVGTAFATLGGWLPRIVGVAELALGQLIQALLLGPQDLELVLPFRGVELGGTRLGGIVLLLRDIRRSAPTG